MRPVMDMSREDEEMAKRLDATLRGGQPIISLDNIEGTIGGACLCLFAERPLISIRLLGKSRTEEIETRATLRHWRAKQSWAMRAPLP